MRPQRPRSDLPRLRIHDRRRRLDRRHASLIRSFADPRIRLVANERNLGLTRSLNPSFALANGELIARQDAAPRKSLSWKSASASLRLQTRRRSPPRHPRRWYARSAVDPVEGLERRFHHDVLTRDLPEPRAYLGLHVDEKPVLRSTKHARACPQRAQPHLLHVHFLGDHGNRYSAEDWA